MEKLNELANRLTKLGYTARVFSTAQEAKDYLLESIPQSDTVGVGGSMTVRQLGLAEALRGRGQQVYWHWDSDDANAARRGAASADTYLCSANAVTESGLRPSTRQHVSAFQKILESSGVTATVRRTLGPDIDASCGQLRRSYIEQSNEKE